MLFVTIATKNREQYFGKIVDGKMILNEIGIICFEELRNMICKRNAVNVHEFVIMPDHVHILLVISDYRRDVGLPRPNNDIADKYNDIADKYNDIADKASLVPTANIVNQSLGSIIGWRKSAVMKKCNENWFSFARQSRYHDHIIRNSTEYDRIKHYIQTNPQN